MNNEGDYFREVLDLNIKDGALGGI